MFRGLLKAVLRSYNFIFSNATEVWLHFAWKIRCKFCVQNFLVAWSLYWEKSRRDDFSLFFFAPQWLMFFVSDLKHFQKRIPSKVLFWSMESTWSTWSAVICQGWLGILLAKYCAGSKETSEEAAYTLDPWSMEKEGDSRMKFGSFDHLDCWFSSWLYQLHLVTWFLRKTFPPERHLIGYRSMCVVLVSMCSM